MLFSSNKSNKSNKSSKNLLKKLKRKKQNNDDDLKAVLLDSDKSAHSAKSIVLDLFFTAVGTYSTYSAVGQVFKTRSYDNDLRDLLHDYSREINDQTDSKAFKISFVWWSLAYLMVFSTSRTANLILSQYHNLSKKSLGKFFKALPTTPEGWLFMINFATALWGGIASIIDSDTYKLTSQLDDTVMDRTAVTILLCAVIASGAVETGDNLYKLYKMIYGSKQNHASDDSNVKSSLQYTMMKTECVMVLFSSIQMWLIDNLANGKLIEERAKQAKILVESGFLSPNETNALMENISSEPLETALISMFSLFLMALSKQGWNMKDIKNLLCCHLSQLPTSKKLFAAADVITLIASLTVLSLVFSGELDDLFSISSMENKGPHLLLAAFQAVPSLLFLLSFAYTFYMTYDITNEEKHAKHVVRAISIDDNHGSSSFNSGLELSPTKEKLKQQKNKAKVVSQLSLLDVHGVFKQSSDENEKSSLLPTIQVDNPPPHTNTHTSLRY